MSYKVPFLLLTIFGILHILSGKNGPTYSKKELGEKIVDMGKTLEEMNQLIQQNFLLTMREIEKLKEEVKELKKKVLQLEAANLSLLVNNGEPNKKAKAKKELKKSRSVPVEHSQQLIYTRGSKHDVEELGTQVDQVFMSDSINSWDIDACHKDLEIIGPENLVVQHRGAEYASRSVFAKSNILKHNFGIFYFEVKLLCNGPVAIGLAPKTMHLNGWLGFAKNSYAYSNGGHILGDGTNLCIDMPRFVKGDTVGCGVNLMTRQLIYALNGEALNTQGLLVSSTEDLFPCITLLQPNSQIEANFGPNFDFGTILATLQSNVGEQSQTPRTSSLSVETVKN